MSPDLLYPRPQPSDYELHYALHELQEKEDLFLRFLSDPVTVLSEFNLDQTERDLLITHDYAGLVARGIHPVMVVQFQRHIEWGMKMSAEPSPG